MALSVYFHSFGNFPTPRATQWIADYTYVVSTSRGSFNFNYLGNYDVDAVQRKPSTIYKITNDWIPFCEIKKKNNLNRMRINYVYCSWFGWLCALKADIEFEYRLLSFEAESWVRLKLPSLPDFTCSFRLLNDDLLVNKAILSTVLKT